MSSSSRASPSHLPCSPRPCEPEARPRIAVEDPGSRGARDELIHWGLQPIPVPVDEHGLRVDELARSLLDPPDTLAVKVRAARTDGRAAIDAEELSDGTRNLLQILASLRGSDPQAEAAAWDGRRYSSLKSDVADAVVSALSPVQDRVRELLEDSAGLGDVLADGARRARETAGVPYGRVAAASGLSKPL